MTRASPAPSRGARVRCQCTCARAWGIWLFPYPRLQFLEGNLQPGQPARLGRDGLRHMAQGGCPQRPPLIWRVPLPPALSHTLLPPLPRLPPSLVRSPRLSRQCAIILKKKENILVFDKPNICMSVFREIPIWGGLSLFFFPSLPIQPKV